MLQRSLIIIFIAFILISSAAAEEKEQLKIGEPVPKFVLKDADDKEYNPEKLSGKIIQGEMLMQEVGHPEDKYGKELAIVKDMGIGPTMAARAVGDMLYTIGRGRLHIFDISNPADPKIVGKADGLRNTRQIAVSNGIAYITSRDNGVFIVDVGNPKMPELLCHYDTIELATGVDVSGNILFVACRHHGVELVDVSNPRKPMHLSAARTGEAQSVAVRNGYAYTGVWGTSELVVVDVKNPREPKITSRCPLDGFGDGVAVKGKHVYVATGHHSRMCRWRPNDGGILEENDPAYGHGHGLEIFDISNPAEPAFVSRIKTPSFFRHGNDMWGVKVVGDHAFVADTHNGVFVVNIKNPEKPFFVAHRQLPYIAEQELPGYVGGLDLTKDHIYVAGGSTDLHVVEAPGLAKACISEPDEAPVILPFKPRENKRFRIYRPDSQVRAVDFMDDIAIVAAGSGGIHILQLWPEIKVLNRYDTEGFAMEVKVLGKQVYVAEESGGLSIWQESGRGSITFRGRYQSQGPTVRNVVVPTSNYALLKRELSLFEIVDISNPTEPKCVLRDTAHGHMSQIGEHLIENRYAYVLWSRPTVSFRWYDLSGGNKPKAIDGGYKCGFSYNTGTFAFRDKILVISRGGFLLVDREGHCPPEEMEMYRVDKHPLRGKPRIYGNKLYVSERASGDISIVDILDINKPNLLEHFNVPGNPGRLVLHNGILIIPNGYEGLWIDREKLDY